MGRYWSEMDPAGAEAQNRRTNRILRILALRKILENISLSRFTAGELKPLFRVMGVIGVGHDPITDPDEHDLKLLESKLRELEKNMASQNTDGNKEDQRQ